MVTGEDSGGNDKRERESEVGLEKCNWNINFASVAVQLCCFVGGGERVCVRARM